MPPPYQEKQVEKEREKEIEREKEEPKFSAEAVKRATREKIKERDDLQVQEMIQRCLEGIERHVESCRFQYTISRSCTDTYITDGAVDGIKKYFENLGFTMMVNSKYITISWEEK